MLIKCERHTEEDLLLYDDLNEMDIVNFENNHIKEKEEKAKKLIKNFIELHRGNCYCSVSWGKDSVVVADLCLRVDKKIPIVWIKVLPIYNPYCVDVRDKFLYIYKNICYTEYVSKCIIDNIGCIHSKGTLEKGFKKACIDYGNKYITGIRSEESAIRTLRSKMYGEISVNTCAPINHWKNQDVFAYLAYYDLPIHPNYAMLGGGRYKREYLRVASLGGKRGMERGRREWEKEYYGDYIMKYEKL